MLGIGSKEVTANLDSPNGMVGLLVQNSRRSLSFSSFSSTKKRNYMLYNIHDVNSMKQNDNAKSTGVAVSCVATLKIG